MRIPMFFAGFLTLVAVFMTCGQLSTLDGGGGSEVEVVGCALFPNGEPAANTQVKLIPRNYNAVTMIALDDSLIDTSDASGGYVFKDVAAGWYNVQAVHLSQRTRFLITGVKVALRETTFVQSEVLREPGAIRFLLPKDGSHRNGYAIIPGTDIASFPAPDSGEIMLDSVPVGIMPEVRFVAAVDTSTVTIVGVTVMSGDTTTIANPAWKYVQSIRLNTTASGANVERNVPDFPLLIRLNAANFDFSQTLANGADIRFTKTDNTFLPFEIERWDAANRQAEVWVKVDTVYGNDSMQTLFMYWGNPASESTSNGSAVFDTAIGFQGVWHLNERGNEVALDATVNDYDGMAYNMPGFSQNPGVIGNARIFNGTSSYITMPNTADGKLDFPQGGNYTISAWVLVDSLDYNSHVIVSKGYEQYYLRITSLRSTVPLWEFVEFNETSKWQTLTFPATSRQWTLLTGVRQGSKQYLYCNGVCVDSTIEGWQNAVSRSTANNLSIGRFLQAVNVPIPGEGYDFFKGTIDEVRILGKAQSRDWIRLCFMNQKSEDRLVQFK
jgi:hypothetical protein